MISNHMSQKEDWLKIAAFIVSMIIYFANTVSEWLSGYNGTPLVRLPLLRQKSGLSRGVASRQG